MQKLTSILLDNGRALEWASSVGLLSLAVTMALPGETTLTQGFEALRRAGLDDALAGVVLGIVSTARIAALYINGSWRRSPMLRMIGAILGASIYSMLAVGFAFPFLAENSPLGSEAGIFLTLALFDALSIYRSGGDVRHSQEFSRV